MDSTDNIIDSPVRFIIKEWFGVVDTEILVNLLERLGCNHKSHQTELTRMIEGNTVSSVLVHLQETLRNYWGGLSQRDLSSLVSK